MSQSSPSTSARPRRRKILISIGVVLLGLFAFLALLPTFISWGLGQGIIRGQIAKQVNGTVEWRSLSLGWFSGVDVEELSIVSDDQKTQIDLSINIGAGLLGLAFGNLDLGEIGIAGTVQGVRRADGTASIGDLVKKSERPRDAGAPEPADDSSGLPTSLAAFVQIKNVDVTIIDEATGETLGVNDFSGSVDFSTQRPITVDLRGATRAGTTGGVFTMKGSVSQLFGSDGKLTLDATNADLETNLEQVSLAMVDALLGLDNRLASLTGDMLQQANIAVSGGLANGSVLLNVNSDLVRIGGVVNIVDSVAQVSPDASFVIQARPTDALLAAYLRDQDASARPTLFSEGDNPPVILMEVSKLQLKIPSGGELDLSGNSVTANIRASGFGIEVPRQERNERLALTQFTAELTSTDLTETFSASMGLSTALNGTPTGQVTGTIRADRLIRTKGEVIVDPQRIVASLEARDLPVSLAQLFLASLPVNLAEDIGPTLNLKANANADAPGSLSLIADAEYLHADLRAHHSPESGLTGEPSSITLTLNDKLMTVLTQDRIRVPRTITLSIDALRVPVSEENEGLATDQATLAGRLVFAGDPIGADREATPLMSRFDVGFDVAAAGPSAQLNGSAMIDNASITISQGIRLVPAEDAAPIPTLARLRPEGTVTIELPNSDLITSFVPEQRVVLDALIGGALTTTISTEPTDGGFTAALTARSPRLAADVSAHTDSEAITIRPSTLVATLSTALLEAFVAPVSDADGQPLDRPALTRPGTVALRDLTLAVPFREDGGLDTTLISMSGGIAVEGAPTLRLKQSASGVTVAELRTEFTATLGEALDVQSQGAARLLAAADREITTATFSAGAKRADSASPIEPTIDIEAPVLAMAALESALGLEAGILSAWTGEQGSIMASVSPQENEISAELTVDFPRVGGTYLASLSDALLIVTASDPRLTLTESALQKLLNPPPTEGTPGAPMLLVQGDVPLEIAWNSFQLPRAVLTGEPADDPAQMNVNLQLTARAPLVLIEPMHNNARREIRDVKATVESTNLASIRFGLTGEATASDADPGSINIAGTLRRLLAEDKTFSTENAVIDLTVNATSLPTAVIDAVQRWDGLIASALGPTVDADIKAAGFSTRTGSVEASFSSATSRLATRMLGRREALVMEQGANSQGSFELSPAFRQKLLEKIHPLLADIRTTENPITLNASNTLLPLDGDIARLRADMVLTIGKMEIDKGSTLLRALTLVQREGSAVIKGSIEPIRANIRNGVVTYDRFAITLGDLTLAYNGRVDLVNRTVDIYTELPMDAMTLGIKELQGKVATIPIRLRTHGGFDALKTEPAPLDEVRSQQLLRALAEIGTQQLLPEARGDGRTAQIAQIATLAIGGASGLLKQDSNNQVGSLLNMNQEALNKELSRQIQSLLLKELGLSDPGNILENLLRDRDRDRGGSSGSGGGRR